MRTILVTLMLVLAAKNVRAERNEPATYVIGNLKQLTPGSAGTLSLYQENGIFKSGEDTLLFDYSNITRVEIGAKVKQTMGEKVSRVWARRKRNPTYPSPTQYLTVEFKTDDGSEHMMTLEVPEPDASVIEEILEGRRDPDHDPPPPSAIVKTPDQGWWGDSVWKTNRNNETWDSKPPESNSSK